MFRSNLPCYIGCRCAHSGLPFLPPLQVFFREIRSSERRAILRRRHPDDPSEHPTDVPLALEPAQERHLEDGSCVIPQQIDVDSFPYAPDERLATDRDPEG